MTEVVEGELLPARPKPHGEIVSARPRSEITVVGGVRQPPPTNLNDLSNDGFRLVMAGMADNTRLAYSTQLSKFDAWCRSKGLPTTIEAPSTPAMVIDYLGYLGKTPTLGTGIPTSPSTVAVALAAIRYRHRDLQDSDPTWWVPQSKKLKDAYTGYCREWLKAGYRPKQAAATTWDDLVTYDLGINRATVRGRRDIALILLSFWMAARGAEIASLRTSPGENNLVFNDRNLKVFLPGSKTNKSGAGEWVTVPRYNRQPELCAVRAVGDWVDMLREAGYEDGPLFPQMQAGLSPNRLAPRFPAMTATAVSQVTTRHAKALGLGKRSAHSHRRGAATIADERGAKIKTIQKMGRWKTVDALLRYIDLDGYEHPLA